MVASLAAPRAGSDLEARPTAGSQTFRIGVGNQVDAQSRSRLSAWLGTAVRTLRRSGTYSVSMLSRLRSLIDRPRDRPREPRRATAIPDEIGRRLHADNAVDPLFPKLSAYGRGVPGVTREREAWWIIRDERGHVVGGAMVAGMGRDHPVSIDVAVDPVAGTKVGRADSTRRSRQRASIWRQAQLHHSLMQRSRVERALAQPHLVERRRIGPLVVGVILARVALVDERVAVRAGYWSDEVVEGSTETG